MGTGVGGVVVYVYLEDVDRVDMGLGSRWVRIWHVLVDWGISGVGGYRRFSEACTFHGRFTVKGGGGDPVKSRSLAGILSVSGLGMNLRWS